MSPGKGDCQRWRVMSGGVAISQSEWDVSYCGGGAFTSDHVTHHSLTDSDDCTCSELLAWLTVITHRRRLADSDYSPITTAFTFLSCARDVVVDRRSALSQTGLAFF